MLRLMRPDLLDPGNFLSFKIMKIPAQYGSKLLYLPSAPCVLYINVDVKLFLRIVLDDISEQVEVHLVIEQVVAAVIIQIVVKPIFAVDDKGAKR